MRSIAPQYIADNIRVNAICPGTVKTGLLEAKAWDSFPQEYFTSIECVRDAVLALVDGKSFTDAVGYQVKEGEAYGKAVEASGTSIYVRDQHAYCDQAMAILMDSTNRTNIKPTS